MKPQYRTWSRALEFAVAIAALITSVTSIWLSLRQGDDMARLVQAQSWPYLEYLSSNTGNAGPAIDIGVRNAGVGPAKVKSFSVVYDGTAVPGWVALIRACCVPDGKKIETTQDLLTLTDDKMISSKLIDRVLRPTDEVILLHLPKTEANALLWKKLDQARFKLDIHACYCSVFDECWITDLRSTTAKSVASCPVDPTPYIE